MSTDILHNYLFERFHYGTLYDIKLIKKYMFKELCKRDKSPSFTSKRLENIPVSSQSV